MVPKLFEKMHSLVLIYIYSLLTADMLQKVYIINKS